MTVLCKSKGKGTVPLAADHIPDPCTRVVYYGALMAHSRCLDGVPKATTGSVRVSVSFDAADYAHVKDIAKEKRVSVAWVVRDAVASYLDARTPLFARDQRGKER